MRLGSIRPVLCSCVLVVLAGCSDSGSDPQTTSEPASAPVQAGDRTTLASGGEFDLANPLGRPDEAAMLRSTPDYSITPTTDTELTPTAGLAIDNGTMIDPVSQLPGEGLDPGQIDIDLGTNPIPTDLGSENLDPF